MGPVFKPDGDASWGKRLWPSCKYLTALWCCPRQMSALNNPDYTSHSLHSWRNRSMWHLDAAAALVSFSGFSFEECLLWSLKLFITFFTQVSIKATSVCQCDLMRCAGIQTSVKDTPRRQKHRRHYALSHCIRYIVSMADLGSDVSHSLCGWVRTIALNSKLSVCFSAFNRSGQCRTSTVLFCSRGFAGQSGCKQLLLSWDCSIEGKVVSFSGRKDVSVLKIYFFQCPVTRHIVSLCIRESCFILS